MVVVSLVPFVPPFFVDNGCMLVCGFLRSWIFFRVLKPATLPSTLTALYVDGLFWPGACVSSRVTRLGQSARIARTAVAFHTGVVIVPDASQYC
jgi:ABC-type uncharacterized transport system permease subunit